MSIKITFREAVAAVSEERRRTQKCPTDGELERYRAGELPGVADHLSVCPRCCSWYLMLLEWWELVEGVDM
jgi:hypothetical protein